MRTSLSATEPEAPIKDGRHLSPVVKKIILFHHIPRTGGTTFRHFISQAFNWNEINPVPYDETAGKPRNYPTIHSPNLYHEHQFRIMLESDSVKIVMGHYDYSLATDNFTSVVLLRNPVERAWSEWRHHITHIDTPSVWRGDTEGITDFKNFINTNEGFARISNQQTAILCGSRWGKQPYSLEVAKQNLWNSWNSFYGFTENYPRFLIGFSQRFNVKNYPMAQYNTAPSMNIVKKQYETLKILNNDDLELYDYAQSLKI